MKKTTKVKKKKNAFSVFFGLSNGLLSISGHCLKCFRSLTALVAKMMEKKNPLCVLHAIKGASPHENDKACLKASRRQMRRSQNDPVKKKMKQRKNIWSQLKKGQLGPKR